MSIVVTYVYFAVILVLIWVMYSKEKKLHRGLIQSLKDEKEKSAKYIEDLDGLLFMLTQFQEMGMAYRKAEDLAHLCELIVEYATDLANTDIGSLMLIDKTTNRLGIKAAKGLSEEVVNMTSMEIGEGIAGRVAQEGKPIYCENIEEDVRFMRDSQMKYGSKSFMSFPLKVKNKVIGVLNINKKTAGEKFRERDRRLLSILADQAAIAIENIQLYEDMKHMYLGTIQTLAKAIDARDPYTKGHTARVTKYAVEIAREMQLPYKLIRNIEIASLIHDIGKIGIKDNVLLKPGHLSDSEYEKIKKHPRIGEQIIAPIEFLTNVAPLVLYHHERYDGNGYLEGLKAEEIPIGARIIHVADAFEAMTSNRPYSSGISKAKAVAELKTHNGRQFDPKVVKAFLRILARNGTLEEREDNENREKTESPSGTP